MANDNGKPKPKVKKYAAGQKVNGAFGDQVTRVKEYDPNENAGTWLNSIIRNPIQQGMNFLGNWAGGARDKVGAGAGDLFFGSVDKGYYDRQNASLPRTQQASSRRYERPNAMFRDKRPNVSAMPEEADPKSLADYLAAAAEMLGGAGGGGGVSYDPQRATARGQAAENDARLEAMYRQLRGSIDADAPAIQQAYQQAIDSTASTSAAAQQQTQAAADSATARNDQVLANLGIQQASGNQIQEGRDLASQTARSIADQATRGQAAGTRLAEGQAASLSHNTNVGNAAGLEGNLQRAANQSRLQALLADIDMQEQQQNASRQDNSFSQKMQLAGQLLDFDRYGQERQDQIDANLANMMNERDIAAMKAQSQPGLPDLGTYLSAIGKDASWLREEPQDAARLLDVLRRFGIQA